jgi:hypothetical protein
MPRSKTFVFSEAWRQDSGTSEPVASIVERWRHLQKGSTRQSRRADAAQRAQTQAAGASGAAPVQAQRPTGT